jgi:hypothetical protein
MFDLILTEARPLSGYSQLAPNRSACQLKEPLDSGWRTHTADQLRTVSHCRVTNHRTLKAVVNRLRRQDSRDTILNSLAWQSAWRLRTLKSPAVDEHDHAFLWGKRGCRARTVMEHEIVPHCLRSGAAPIDGVSSQQPVFKGRRRVSPPCSRSRYEMVLANPHVIVKEIRARMAMPSKISKGYDVKLKRAVRQTHQSTCTKSAVRLTFPGIGNGSPWETRQGNAQGNLGHGRCQDGSTLARRMQNQKVMECSLDRFHSIPTEEWKRKHQKA